MTDATTVRDEALQRLVSGTVSLGYREWNWGEGVAHYALVRAGQLLGSGRCFDEVGAFLHANEHFEPDRAEHIMPALASILYYEETGDELAMTLATRVTEMLRSHPKSRHGAYIATPVRSAWVDYIFETVPFLCHYSRITGSREYQDWAVEQTVAYLMSCWNAHDGLFAHVYYDDVGVSTPFYWARANGWAALGLLEAAALLPESTGLMAPILRVFRQLSDSLVKWQHPSGMWSTVLCDPRTYEETSAAAMISLALHRGARLSWLAGDVVARADSAWQAVCGQIADDGSVARVSGETPPGDADYYQSVPLGVYPWGQGFTLLAALERTYAERFDHIVPSGRRTPA